MEAETPAMRIIDLETWNRKEHYEFFSKYDDPFYGVVSEVECTETFLASKKSGDSFFAKYLYASTKAVNEVPALKLRVVDGQIVECEKIHAGSTIARKDGTFAFSFMSFSESFTAFQAALLEEIEATKNSTGLRLNASAMRPDVIHYSTLPWNKFTGLTHARNFNNSDTVPKITFGKAFERDGKWMLPTSVDVHHGLVDGLHIAQYFEAFE